MNLFLRAIVAPLLGQHTPPPAVPAGLPVRTHTLRDDEELTVDQANQRAAREIARLEKLARARAERDARAAQARARADLIRARAQYDGRIKHSAKPGSIHDRILQALATTRSMSGPELLARLGCAQTALYVALRQLEVRGHLHKTGARRHFQYHRTDRERGER